MADEKSAPVWRALGMSAQGCLFALTDKAWLQFTVDHYSGLTANRATGSTVWMPMHLSHLALAYADLGKFDDARRCIGEATTAADTTKETWYEAETNRMAGKITSLSPDPGKAKRKPISSGRWKFPPTAGKLMGTPRSNEHGAALARSRKAAASSRTACAGYAGLPKGSTRAT